MNNQASTPSGPSSRTIGWLIFLVFMAIIAYLLTNGHTVHVLSALPFLILLACPLMMFFMMKGMSKGGQDGPGPTMKR